MILVKSLQESVILEAHLKYIMSNIQAEQHKVKPKTPKIEELLERSKSVILATIEENGDPMASYAPYVYIDGSFHILVSFMAKHTRNLKDRKKASLMFIEDESATKQIYARDRMTIDCDAEVVSHGSDSWNRGVEALKARHGKIVDMLAELNDFILIKLKPVKGSYVNGFGSAYTVNADLTIHEHVRGAHGQHEEQN